jgi:hypothetical protein
MKHRTKGIKAEIGWSIALLEEAQERLRKYRQGEDHGKNLKLKTIQMRVDMVLVIAKRLQKKYDTRKQEDTK